MVARSIASTLTLLLCLALGACSTLPPRAAGEPASHALAIDVAAATPLGRVAAASVANSAESGFQLLPVASAAYETRLALAQHAERSIDMQTFVLHADDSGKYLLHRLQAAAARGVRVRLLIDDLHTAGVDELLSSFAAVNGVEVRLFNPFLRGRDAIVVPSGSYEERRARFAALASQAEPPPLDETVPLRLQRYITTPSDIPAGSLPLLAADAQLRADPVDKTAGSRLLDRSGTVRAFIGEAMGAAKEEVFVVSPYFIPGEIGMRVMQNNIARGVRLRLLTNSLASTDEPVVHAGYIRYRKKMVELGVEIHELSPDLARERGRLGRFGKSLGALHAKIVVIDKKRLFVGSMNLDGRSERYNTELGVLIDSPQLASEFLDMMDFESSAYRLQMNAQSSSLEWARGDTQEVLADEPGVSPWLHFKVRALGALIPEDWL